MCYFSMGYTFSSVSELGTFAGSSSAPPFKSSAGAELEPEKVPSYETLTGHQNLDDPT